MKKLLAMAILLLTISSCALTNTANTTVNDINGNGNAVGNAGLTTVINM